MHLIEPLEGGGEEVQHALYRAEHLLQKAGTCGVSNSSLEKALGPRVSAAFRPRVRAGPGPLPHPWALGPRIPTAPVPGSGGFYLPSPVPRPGRLRVVPVADGPGFAGGYRSRS